MNKEKAMFDLHEDWHQCLRCHLSEASTNVCVGEGNPDADILIVGKAPGGIEDRTGHLFCGDIGGILNGFLDACSLTREEDVYLTTIVSCRPTVEAVDDRTQATYLENRDPNKEEKLCCRPRLLEIIYIVDPLLIITLGKVPFQALTGKGIAIGNIRGQVQNMYLDGRHTQLVYPVLPMYGLTYLNKSSDHRPEGIWGQTGNDWVEVCDIVDYLREAYYGISRPARKWR